ncbi:YhjD/YihY/BrkB family envelope integrity protein [Conexibacter sp. JD483]|uniref:YhjD/YihY/BrkB family envelope integrity protein n=1 Tax=unclassified Conexibacter TaxID=2627773 RepID=UPI00272327E1|nr:MULTISPECIES: YhjD/YihY/BrkB family envelope integrity protein [unclassified Conexibacter]MDO8186995.1 YhjD/YihY/BrkB family envelope integrity protein [Conexibacter sp. CPCC 205706]MDO8200687.1 YhjD/YihY/BrkB family envelope integrity protein [Conexibacter sp. CPCC 205762]MDR9371488.1 YhjD/YihY/BrkB family envelope integrity protein [Conexibacter sp. JD483]
MRLVQRAKELLAFRSGAAPGEPLAWLSRPIAGRTVPARAVELIRACVDRVVRIQFVDRSIALGSLAFTALVPLLVIIGAYAPGADGIATTLIDRFELDGATAELVQQVFTPPSGSTEGAISVLGVLLLFGSALSFTRGLQRLYELSWRLQARGWFGTVAGLKWLAMVVLWFGVFGSVRTWLLDHTGPLISLIIALGSGAVLWLFTPYILLAGRVRWRRLLPTALLTSIGMTGLSIGSVVYMPGAIAESADRYGSIGIAIAIVSWLVGIGFVLSACAAVGAVLGGEIDRAPEPASATAAGSATPPPRPDR